MTDTPQDELVERVARAIADRLRDDTADYPNSAVDAGVCPQEGVWGAEIDGEIDLLSLAEAAIAAMSDIAALRAENGALRNQLANLQIAAVEYAANYLADERADIRNCWNEDHHKAVTRLCDEIDEAARALLGSKP